MGKDLGVMKRILKKRCGCERRIQTGTISEQMLLFLAGARLLKLIEII
jgi:hypothetical protein